MKRSSAPSQKGNTKLGRFITPIKNSTLPQVHINAENHNDDVAKKSSQISQNTSLNKSDLSDVSSIGAEHAVSTASKVTSKKFNTPQMIPASIKKPKNVPVNQPEEKSSSPAVDGTKYLSVVWCKRSNKKHKNWEGDAILQVQGRSVLLFDIEGKEIGKSSGYKLQELLTLEEGQTLTVGSKEIEVMGKISEEDFLRGKCFSGAHSVTSQNSQISAPKLKSLPKTNLGDKLLIGNKSSQSSSITLKPRFDPKAPNALVLTATPAQLVPKGAQVVDVVVDPYITVHLRPHQRTGVNFLYECIMGYKEGAYGGAILADAMGLGKTLQVIALLWTLLKQNPVSHKPVVRRVLIITPGSLVKNWLKEFKKWLGTERLNVFAVAGDNKAQDFKNMQVSPVMIVSYEMFVRCCESIKQSKFDILICDEGHRLKNGTIKTSQMHNEQELDWLILYTEKAEHYALRGLWDRGSLNNSTMLLQSLVITKKIVVTGTPIQNDLKEFYSLVDFCSPGLLGTQASFHRLYEDPILRSKQLGCSREERLLGEERAKELSYVTSNLILRRTNDVNEQYLPPKNEYVVFCKASRQQVELYKRVVSSCQTAALLDCQGDGNAHLISINQLKKICNHPSLLNDANELGKENLEVPSSLDSENVTVSDFSLSGKLSVLHSMLLATVSSSKDKVVVVSNYTKTLDMLEGLCKQMRLMFLRLDGQTSVNRRQDIVEKFNSNHSTHRVFLLSSKAGGVGLNLIGANRLILYDIDWNPANDLQAMARIWRDGQKKPVHIYRLLTAGTIEEKIYQRQIFKLALGNSIVDTVMDNGTNFSKEDLRDLFVFRPDAICETHEMLNCQCQSSGDDTKVQPHVCLSNRPDTKPNIKDVCMSELTHWKHLSVKNITQGNKDSLLEQAEENITFLFTSQNRDTIVQSESSY